MSTAIRYYLRVANLHAHHFEITIEVDSPNATGQRFSCPRWIPGSYLIRDFAKHILSVTATDEQGKPLVIVKEDIATWLVKNPSEKLVVKVLIYAWDYSVRGSHLDHFHGFFNPVTGCLQAQGKADQPCVLTVECPDEKTNWHCATGMKPLQVNANGFGSYQASNYHELIDSPIEMSDFEVHEFQAGKKLHKIVLTGPYQGSAERLQADVAKICQHLQDWMGDPALDFDTYTFLCQLTENSYGGLEHCTSSALMTPRKYMPRTKTAEVTDEYAVLLGLFSHEYFHNWFIKRIKPENFTPYRYDEISLTEQLWIFEGFTSYYDDLSLVRAGVISKEQYLKAIAKTITRYMSGPGHKVQSVTASSFDAWIKFYQPNENTPNAIVSYYVKGGLIALCLDALIRKNSNNEKKLDDLIRDLWKEFSQVGAPEKAIEDRICAFGGPEVEQFLHKALYTTEPLPLIECLSFFGVKLDFGSDSGSKSGILQGMKIDTAKNRVTTVLSGSPAEKAGIAPDDLLVAIDNFTFTPQRLSGLPEGAVAALHFFRDGVLRETSLLVVSEPKLTAKLSFEKEAQNKHDVQDSWLNWIN